MASEVAGKVDKYFSKYPRRSYPKGQIIVFADENPKHIYYIVRGSVRKYDVSYRGDEVVVNIFKPPAFFPMSWAINKTPNDYFYKAETETELHIVPTDEALKFVQDNPDVAFDLLSRLYKGMDGVLGRMVHLMSGSAKSRVIYEMVVECHRFGKKQADRSIMLNVSESDLAGRTGLSRETVSREIHKLKAENLVVIKRNGILVKGLKLLEKKIGIED